MYAGPAGGAVGSTQLGEAVGIALGAGEHQFAVGGEFEKIAVGKLGVGTVVFQL